MMQKGLRKVTILLGLFFLMQAVAAGGADTEKKKPNDRRRQYKDRRTHYEDRRERFHDRRPWHKDRRREAEDRRLLKEWRADPAGRAKGVKKPE